MFGKSFIHSRAGFRGPERPPAPSRVLAEMLFDQVRTVDRLPGLPRGLAMLGLLRGRRGVVGEADVGCANRIGVGDPGVERQRLAPAPAGPRDLAPGHLDVAEALDAIGLTEHVAYLPVESQRLLVAPARALVIGAVKGDVAEARDAIGLALQVADVTKSLRDPRQGSLRRKTGNAVQLAKPVYSRP